MITVKLCGGIGNQFFQYAYGYQMAKKLDTDLILDISWFKRQKLREPEILNFAIKYDRIEEVWDSNFAVGFFNKTFINRSLRVIGLWEYSIGGYKYLKEIKHKYVERIANYAKDNAYLDGYWQCPRYFDSVRNELIRMYQTDILSPGVVELGEKLKLENSVAIHIRRGDYPQKKVWISNLVALSNGYYKKAVDHMLGKISDPKVYVFSNDMDDAIGMLKPMLPDLIYDTGLKTTAIDEWYLMKCCRNQIIGNSTFSWWSAYLNEYEKKMVIAPNKYMGNYDIIPSEWIQIEVE